MMEEEGAGPSSLPSPKIPSPTAPKESPPELDPPPLDPTDRAEEIGETRGSYRLELEQAGTESDMDGISRTSEPPLSVLTTEDEEEEPRPSPRHERSLDPLPVLTLPEPTQAAAGLEPESQLQLPPRTLRSALKKQAPSGERAPSPPRTEFGAQPRVAFDRDYLFSPQGCLKFLQVVFAIVFCGVVGSYCEHEYPEQGVHQRTCFRAAHLYDQGFGGLGFELFVGGTTIIVSLILFVVNLFSGSKVPHKPWELLELLYTAIAAFFFFVSWCIHAKYTADNVNKQLLDQYIAGTVFGICLMFFYGLDTYFQASHFIDQ